MIQAFNQVDSSFEVATLREFFEDGSEWPMLVFIPTSGTVRDEAFQIAEDLGFRSQFNVDKIDEIREL